MKICIDTNAYIFMKKGKASLVQFLEQVDQIFISTIVLGELHAGFYMGNDPLTKIKDLDSFLETPGVEVVLIDKDISRRYGELVMTLKQKKIMIATNDLWIAATSFEKGATLVSYDRDFQRIPGLSLLTP